jgi:hypothetical protein
VRETFAFIDAATESDARLRNALYDLAATQIVQKVADNSSG